MTDEPAEAITFEPSALLAELKETAKAPQLTELPSRLPLVAIRQIPEVFQPRGNNVCERHVSELRKIIAASGDVDPITVMQVGTDAVLIDGHHRLAAYAQVNRATTVPVKYFEGTLEEAILEAGRANSKAKLPMSTQERQNYAWRLVLMDNHSKAEIASASGASKSQVANMRTVMKKLGAEAFGHPSWWRAREAAKGRGETHQMSEQEIEIWKDEMASRYADRLTKEFSSKLSSNTEIAARALSIYFGRRLGELVGELREHLAEDGDSEF